MNTQYSLDNGFVSTLYTALSGSMSHEAKPAFDAWKIHWDSLHGEVGHKRSAKINVLTDKYGVDAERINPSKLLFAIESYYVLKLRLIAYMALLKGRSKTISLRNNVVRAGEPNGLMRRLFRHEVFAELGVQNYGGAELFSWVTSVLDEGTVASVQRETIDEIQRQAHHYAFDGRDHVRDLFHRLVPKEFRHSIGAYYTPDWLADYILQEVDYTKGGKYSELTYLLDPQCGSGTFLISALSKAYKVANQEEVTATQWRDFLENRICGFEIDPVAVIAAKTNLILFASKLSQENKLNLNQPLRLPIYLCDSIYSAEVENGVSSALFDEGLVRAIKIGRTIYSLPSKVAQDRKSWDEFANALLNGVKANATFDSVLAELRRNRLVIDKCYEDTLKGIQALYSDLCKKAINGAFEFYSQLLLDAIQPNLTRNAEVVVGNPPWVNWEYLPNSYKELIKPIWPKLGLFDARGTDKAFSKEDLSVLATYMACSRYLKDKGKLGFLIPQSIFKSSKNSKGFRRFQIGTSGPYLKVLKVDDLSETHAFDQATNRAAIIFLRKGFRTTFPVPYIVWQGGTQTKGTERWRTWSEAAKHFDLILQKANPVDPNDPTSSWMHGTDTFLSSLNEMSGTCPYRARIGVFTGGANAVFYLRKIKKLESGNYLVENVTDRARRVVKEVRAEIEPTYVYPFLRGRDVDFWQASVDLNRLILCPHTPETGMRPVGPEELLRTARHTYKYVNMFRDALESRGGLTGFDRVSFNIGFYSLLRIGDYTFAPYKVVWRYISKEFKSCVVEPVKSMENVLPVLPQEKLMLIGLYDRSEAYYVCGLLSSDLVREAVESRMVGTQISASVIEHLALPIYDSHNPLHQDVAESCREGHRAKMGGGDFIKHLKNINDLVPRLLK